MKNVSTITKFITLKELAQIFWLSEASIRRLINWRKIKFYKIWWVIRFRESDIEEYLSDVQVEQIK